jgi:septal ring-binding cell division protein DamX
MQVETTAHLACPLCKRQFLDSSEHAWSTRLCQQCQAMVLTAFRGSNAIIPQSAVSVPQTTAPLPIQHDEQAFDQGFVGAPALFELTPAEEIASETQSRPPIPFDTPEPVKFDFYQDEDPAYKTNGSPANSPDFTNDVEIPARMEGFEASVEEVVACDHESFDVDEQHLIGQSSANSESTIESAFDGADVVEGGLEHTSSSAEQVGTDEWQTPVATWDSDWDSSGEWPLLVAPSSEPSFRKPRLAIAAVALVAMLASAAGVYFLIYASSHSQERRAGDASAVEPRAVSVGSAVTATLAPAVQTPSENAAAARDAATTDNSVQGQFSLQAASFPTQEGADEFAERLRRAGVPSYVVPAELLRRGRWFRVRVGRFNSAEDAQRFAGEAQQRARAAGIAVQLIVCQYGQP